MVNASQNRIAPGLPRPSALTAAITVNELAISAALFTSTGFTSSTSRGHGPVAPFPM